MIKLNEYGQYVVQIPEKGLYQDRNPDNKGLPFASEAEAQEWQTAWLAAHPDVSAPAPVAVKNKVISKYKFRRQLTFAEKVAILTAAKTDVEVEVVVGDLMSADDVTLTDTGMIEGLALLVFKGLLTEARMNKLLEGV